MRSTKALLLVSSCLIVAAGYRSVAQDRSLPSTSPAPARFLRVERQPDGKPLAMETAIVRYETSDARARPVTVDLVAAIHIADKAYYERLNREFTGYDAVLYELVAPPNVRAPRRDDAVGRHPVALLQNGMKDVLALEFQLQGIDYTPTNMIHADMSPDQVAESMRTHGETTMTILARMFGYALARQNESSEGAGNAELIMALFDKNRSLALKRIMAEQFAGSEDSMAALEGLAGATLIGGRNKVALEVLRQQIAAGKRRIAIFYGAAHMADFQTRLRDEFKMTPVNVRWLAAWKLTP